MTRRATLMLAALEDGCATRDQIYAHAGRFFLCNNAASDLRRAGIPVLWERDTDTYRLLDDAPRDYGAESTTFPLSVGRIVEQDGGQYAIEVAA